MGLFVDWVLVSKGWQSRVDMADLLGGWMKDFMAKDKQVSWRFCCLKSRKLVGVK